jgi:hypothetical protein
MKTGMHLPDVNKISVVMAMIALSLSLSKVLPTDYSVRQFSVSGFIIEFSFKFGTIISLLSALLAAAGMQWLLQDNSKNSLNKNYRFKYFSHWILPVFTTFVISITLNFMTNRAVWWIIFGLGILLLYFVLIAEYNIALLSENYAPVASVGLISLSFTLFLILAISLRTANTRLYVYIPLLTLGAFFVSLRAIYLRLGGEWLPEWVLIIVIIFAQILIGLHYIQISPIAFGLIATGLLFSLTSYLSGVYEKRKKIGLFGEPVAMFLLCLLLSVAIT